MSFYCQLVPSDVVHLKAITPGRIRYWLIILWFRVLRLLWPGEVSISWMDRDTYDELVTSYIKWRHDDTQCQSTYNNYIMVKNNPAYVSGMYWMMNNVPHE